MNTDTNAYGVRKKMEEICQQQFPTNALIMAASNIKTLSTYKPGGTAILAVNDICSRITSHTRDRMGRWASLCLNLSGNRKMRIISAYQTCKNSNPGSNTAASHQTAQIIKEATAIQSILRLQPRQAFIQDLQSFIQQVQQAGEDIVLVGDFNEEMDTNGSGMNQIATTCDLVDLFNLRTGTSTQPATYQRGTKRIDYILMSPNVVHSVHAAGSAAPG